MADTATDRDLLVELRVRTKDIADDVSETKGDVKRINGKIAEHEGRMQAVEQWRGSPLNPEQVAAVLVEHRALMDDFHQRQEMKKERQWLMPLLLSMPPSLLAIATLAYLVAHGGF